MILTEIEHPSHQHNLKLVCNKAPYKCDGCMESGCGQRYRCQDCNYDLHKECALAPSDTTHPFYKNCFFKFLTEGRDGRYCDACGRDVHGFVYHCTKTGHDMHPCCASLPRTLQGEGVKLQLHESASSKCGKCGSKELWRGVRGWSYKSSNGKYQFHVSCVKAMLDENWEKEYFGEGEMITTVTNLCNIPSLQIMLQNGASSSRGKIGKYWKRAKVALQLIISAILGDPITAIASVIQVLVTK